MMKMPSKNTLLVGLLITVTVAVGQAMATFDPETLTDVRVWAVGLLGAVVRQVGAYLVTTFRTE